MLRPHLLLTRGLVSPCVRGVGGFRHKWGDRTGTGRRQDRWEQAKKKKRDCSRLPANADAKKRLFHIPKFRDHTARWWVRVFLRIACSAATTTVAPACRVTKEVRSSWARRIRTWIRRSCPTERESEGCWSREKSSRRNGWRSRTKLRVSGTPPPFVLDFATVFFFWMFVSYLRIYQYSYHVRENMVTW